MYRLPRHIFIVLTFYFYSGFGQIKPTSKTTVVSTSTINLADSISETPPKFLGGDWTKMNKFLIDNLQYPESAKENGLSGNCYVKFTVTSDGTVHDIIILKGVPGCHECDLEAIRVIKLMPTWTPASKNGTPVKTFITTCLKFKIQ